MWDVLESTVQKTNSAYHTAAKELADTKEKLTKVRSVWYIVVDPVC